jgi:SNF2 family DNA or RNA helicase
MELMGSVQGANGDSSESDAQPNIATSDNFLGNLFEHQQYGYSWMVGRETHQFSHQPFGGIIADQMGLGKTIQMISLITHEHQIDAQVRAQNIANLDLDYNLINSQCTLIICPVSVVNHWKNEIARFVKENVLKIHKYHGSKRIENAQQIVDQFNIVISTYGSVASPYSKYYAKSVKLKGNF